MIEDLIRCTALARIVYGDTDWRFAQSESELAEAYWRLKGMVRYSEKSQWLVVLDSRLKDPQL